MHCGLARRVGHQRRVDLVLVGGSEGQRLRNLGDGQIILSRELRRRQTPGAGGDHERLHAQTCPAHDGRRLAARAAAVDDVRKRGIIGARLSEASDLKYRAVAANWILGRMDDTGMEVKIVILDACRNNPFGRSWTRALDRGLAVMDAPKGALIAYSTSPKKTALDGTGRNSPYTARPLQEVPIPGRPIELVFKAVRLGVQQETQGAQTPWEASSLTGEFYFAR
jgi:hypothetical protein